MESEVLIKSQEIENLKKHAALYSKSQVKLNKIERKLSSGTETLASLQSKLNSEIKVKLDTIEKKLSGNIQMLSNLQLKLQTKVELEKQVTALKIFTYTFTVTYRHQSCPLQVQKMD